MKISNWMEKTFSSLKIIFKDPIYQYIAVVFSVIFAYISYWLFYQTSTISMSLDMMREGDFGRFSYAYGITYSITTILIIILSGISMAVTIWLYKHSKLNKTKITAGNAGGLIAGIFSMACPVCGSFLLSLLGVAGGLAIFPLQGLELKFLSIALLLFPIIYGAKKVHVALHCKECDDVTTHLSKKHNLANDHDVKNYSKKIITLPSVKVLILTLAVIFLINQGFLTHVAVIMGLAPKASSIPALFGIKTKTARRL